MMILLVLVFWPLKNPGFSFAMDWPRKVAIGSAFAFFWICPALNLVGRWDHFMSFSLYSGKPPSFFIAVQEDEVAKIDKHLWYFFVSVPGMTGGKILDVDWWCRDELKVPFNPEPRVFRRLVPYFCKLEIPVEKLVFLQINKPGAGTNRVESFNCEEVGEPGIEGKQHR